jgi:hypothetical protein
MMTPVEVPMAVSFKAVIGISRQSSSINENHSADSLSRRMKLL